MISFSKLTKDELLALKSPKNRIRLISIILSIGNLQFSDHSIILEIKTSNISLIRETLKILKNIYSNFNEQLIIRENKKFKKNNKVYIIKIENKSQEILEDLRLIPKKTNGILLNFNIPKEIFKNDATKKEFLRYLFISNGSINNPRVQKQYHLELIFNNQGILEETQSIAKKYDINFKKTTRKNVSALYLNKGEEIADFLRLIGSIDSMFEFENQRLLRDIRATENRLINAEIANETKKQTACIQQLEAIKSLKRENLLITLKEKTQKVAQIRENYPNASLNELVEIVNGDISKTNMRYHLNLLIKEANNI